MVLINCGFFERTSYKGLDVCLAQCIPWDRDTTAQLSVEKKRRQAFRKVHYEDFGHMNLSEFVKHLEREISESIENRRCITAER